MWTDGQVRTSDIENGCSNIVTQFTISTNSRTQDPMLTITPVA